MADNDAVGNRWLSSGAQFDATTPTANVFTANNQFNATNYDAKGNQTQDAGYTFAYDAESRLISSSSSGTTLATYGYDADGRRVTKTACGGTATYVYDVTGQLVAEYDSGTPCAAPPCTGTCYAMTDHLGSTRMLTDTSGHQLTLFDYAPFGEELGSYDGRDARWAGFGSGVHYTGKEQEGYEGAYMHYFGARYFSGGLGRLTSPDPVFASAGHLADPQMWNEYAYVRNNPLKLTDPTGLDFYTTCTHTNDNVGTCQQLQNGSAKVWVQGTSDSNGNFTANRIANDANGNLVDINHGNAAYSGSFDETGVHFTAGGATSTGQFIDGSAQTNVQGSGAFQGMTGMFNSDCGGSCPARGSLWGDTTALTAAMGDGRINEQSKFGTVIDLLSRAHSPGTQWKDTQNLLHIIANANGVNAGVLELHYEGHPTGVDVVNFVLHMVDTIRDAQSGRAAAEQKRALPRN